MESILSLFTGSGAVDTTAAYFLGDSSSIIGVCRVGVLSAFVLFSLQFLAFYVRTRDLDSFFLKKADPHHH